MRSSRVSAKEGIPENGSFDVGRFAPCANAMAQEDKKTDDDKPADPDTGESTVEENRSAFCPIRCGNTA